MDQVKCEKCGKEFKSDFGLKIHVGRQHGSKPKARKAGKKAKRAKATVKIKCNICGRSFGMPAHLARHTAASHDRGKSTKCERRSKSAAGGGAE